MKSNVFWQLARKTARPVPTNDTWRFEPPHPGEFSWLSEAHPYTSTLYCRIRTGKLYSLSLNDFPKFLSGTYLEFLNLEIKGILREPSKYADNQVDLFFQDAKASS